MIGMRLRVKGSPRWRAVGLLPAKKPYIAHPGRRCSIGQGTVLPNPPPNLHIPIGCTSQNAEPKLSALAKSGQAISTSAARHWKTIWRWRNVIVPSICTW